MGGQLPLLRGRRIYKQLRREGYVVARCTVGRLVAYMGRTACSGQKALYGHFCCKGCVGAKASESLSTPIGSILGWVTSRLAERMRDVLTHYSSATSLAPQARAQRWQTFLERFPGLADMLVLDLGGRPAT